MHGSYGLHQVSADLGTPLHITSKHGNVAIAKSLLDHGAGPDEEDS